MSISSLSEATAASFADDDLVARAHSLVPLLSANAREAESSGRLPDEIADGLRQAGFFTLQQPRSLGGLEAGPRTSLEVYRELARGCGSAAWVSMILSGGAYVTSLFGERARDEVWGHDRLAAVCSRFLPSGTSRVVDGGVVVSARCQPLSGVHHSAWALVGFPTPEDAGIAQSPAPDGSPVADSMIALVPIQDTSIENTWHVAGMQGTGSDTAVLEEVFVPAHRIISSTDLFSGGCAGNHPSERLAAGTVRSFLAVTIIGPVLGMAEAALDHTIKSLTDSSTARASGRNEPRIRLAVARAAGLIETATLHGYRAADDVEEGIRVARPLSATLQARIRMDIGTASRSAREAVNLLLDVGGPRSFSLSSPLQRIWRDVEAASRHMLLAPDRALDLYADDLLGPG